MRNLSKTTGMRFIITVLNECTCFIIIPKRILGCTIFSMAINRSEIKLCQVISLE